MIQRLLSTYFMWLMPILEGISHTYFPYQFFWHYFHSELGAWLAKGIFFLGISLFIFGKSFYRKHDWSINGYSCNTITLWLMTYFILGPLLHISGNSVLFAISTSMIFIPILEEFTARGFLINIPRTHKKTLFTLIILSSITFSLSHWFTSESLIGIFSWQQHINKFLAHFVFGLMQAIITINYQRIDLAIILHMIGNISWVVMTL